MFPWLMITFALIFFPPSVPRRLLPGHWLPKPEESPIALEPAAQPTTNRPSNSRLHWALLTTYITLQILLPLRHWLYPGDPCWTEEGFRLSWNVMLMEKNGDIAFNVTDPATAQTWIIDLNDHLTRQQIKMMSTQPDMILAFSHHLAEDFDHRGHPGVEVRADAHVSLNGRPPARLIDPKFDLAQAKDTFLPKPWILPSPETPPRL
jgi:hypothetical protein